MALSVRRTNVTYPVSFFVLESNTTACMLEFQCRRPRSGRKKEWMIALKVCAVLIGDCLGIWCVSRRRREENVKLEPGYIPNMYFGGGGEGGGGGCGGGDGG